MPKFSWLRRSWRAWKRTTSLWRLFLYNVSIFNNVLLFRFLALINIRLCLLMVSHLKGYYRLSHEAGEETHRLIIALAGDADVKRDYVFFSEVEFIPAEALREIDAMWRQHSDEKFGYNMQRRIWNKLNGDFTAFFIKVGWMRKLESSDVEQ
ncbi:hypothetical protein SASPL_152437 [Salvia splendens]|uniref:GUN4-like domain-containing protein n=1 Tax=Salvia splendens TaxID=180675 RepID=A0A8X8W3B0_SALSN|nr:hypothetical protein SASPL_152437 [Salvia splendens]